MLQRGVRILSLRSKCPAEAFGKVARCGAEASNPGWHCKCLRDYFNNQDPKTPTLEVLMYAWPPPDSWSHGVGSLVSHCRSCDFWRRNFYPSEPQFPSKKKNTEVMCTSAACHEYGRSSPVTGHTVGARLV